MKPLQNLNEVLSYQLEGMYQTEKQLQNSCPQIIQNASSELLRAKIADTGENAFNNRLRLKRIFTYLLTEPVESRKTLLEMMHLDLHPVPALTKSSKLGDVLINTALRTLASYRCAEYSAARDIALQLNLQTVVNLLDQIVEKTDQEWKDLADLALREINQRVTPQEC